MSYRQALSALDDYYKTGKTSSLEESLNKVEASMDCPETRRGAAEMKISLLVLLKRYRFGYAFIDSLSAGDFDAGYKKQMYHDYFQALDDESKVDTTDRNKLFNKIIADIHQYIQKERLPKDSLDEDAYLSLFLMKKRVEDSTRIDAEIESLKKGYPRQADFLDGVENAIYERSAISKPMQQQP